MEELRSLGHFSKLPCEIRNMIWTELLPNIYNHLRGEKRDLSILRASRLLYNDVSGLLYECSNLHFNLDEFWWISTWVWSRYTLEGRGKCMIDKGWLRDLKNARARGWFNLPYHRFKKVIVTLVAPSRKTPAELFCVWQSVNDLLEIFQQYEHASHEKISLVIRFSRSAEEDWGHKYILDADRDDGGYEHDHDLVVLPFYSLRNVKSLHVESLPEYCEESETGRRVINWASKILDDRSWKRCDSSKYKPSELAEQDVDRKVAYDYLRMCITVFDYMRGGTARDSTFEFIRRYLWEQGAEKMKTRLLQILNTYPDILNEQLFHNILTDIHELSKR